MKKIYSLLAIFLCVGLIAPVCAFPIEKTHMDSWGRTMMFDNGDAIYFGQTVGVTEASICYNFDFEIIENCTVTVKTNGHVVVVDENGDRIISKNGVEFHYSPNRRVTSMTWNNFPYGGERGCGGGDGYQPITDVMNYMIKSYGKSDVKFQNLPTEIIYKNMTFTQTKYHEPGSKGSQYYLVRYEDAGGYYQFEFEGTRSSVALNDIVFFEGNVRLEGATRSITVADDLHAFSNYLIDKTVDEATIKILEVYADHEGEWTDDYMDYWLKRLKSAPGSSDN